MSMLRVKLRRDLWRMRGQVLSIAAVVAGAVASVLAMGSTLDVIRDTRDRYYESASFPHVFSSLTRAPEEVADRLRALPGVSVVDTRVTTLIRLEVPGLDVPAIGYVISESPGRRLGILHVATGRQLSGRPGEVLLGAHFAEANAYVPGDTVVAVINGRRRTLHVVGVAISPEFVYDAMPGNFSFTDSRHSGIMWMARDELGATVDMDGAFNEVALAIAPGTSLQEVVEGVNRILRPYGGGHAHGRADQLSNRVLDGEIAQLSAFGTVMPAIFLLVAAFLLNVVLARLVATQREEIATIKAFGYGDAALGWHVLGYAMTSVAIGSVLGVALGSWAGSQYTGLYRDYFRFPELPFRPGGTLILIAVAASAVAASLGALGAVRRAVSVPPAEGMRPPSPEAYSPLLLERLGLRRVIPASIRMVLRNVEHQPWRAVASIIGVACAAGVLVAGMFAFDTAMFMSDLLFRKVQREDLSVAFRRPRSPGVRHELASIPGVTRVEPYRMIAVTMSAAQRDRQVAIMAIEPSAELRRLVDVKLRRFRVPPVGLVLTASLAEALRVRAGDSVSVELLERGGVRRVLRVVALVDEMMGMTAFMSLDAAHALAGDVALSGAMLTIRDDRRGEVLRRLGELPMVASATTRESMLVGFERQISEMIVLTATIVSTLAAIIAVGVLYNGARIALSERGRELATLRVLGFTPREVSGLLLGEQGALQVAGIPLGLLLGIGFAYLIAFGFRTELYRFPVIITARTYLLAVAIVLLSAGIAGLALARRLVNLDLISVLKTRE